MWKKTLETDISLVICSQISVRFSARFFNFPDFLCFQEDIDDDVIVESVEDVDSE